MNCFDLPVLRLTDPTGDVTALICPEVGANLINLQVAGRELLRRPWAGALRSRPTGWGIPVLMPPNRIAGGRFRFAGREYRFPVNTAAGHHSHGVVVDRPWLVGDVVPGRARLRFRSTAHADMLDWFPHRFELQLTYTLTAQRLRCEAQLRNDGDGAMPFGLGFHPYLATPGGRENWEVRLRPAAQQWELCDKLPTGAFRSPEGTWNLQTWQSVHAVRRDDGYRLDIVSQAGSECELRDRTTGFAVCVRADAAFRHWVVYNGPPDSHEYVCLEPYTSMTNAFNLSLPTEVSGASAIPASWSGAVGTWEIAWSDSLWE